MSPSVLGSVVLTQSATLLTMREIWTIASSTKSPIGTATMTSADNRVQAADKPAPRRLLNRLKSGVNKYAPTAATTTRTK